MNETHPSHSLYKDTNLTDDFIKIKHHGKIYTPDYLVKIILDRGHYNNDQILRKHVIDNSCGDGQFMVHVVQRYCNEFLKRSKDTQLLKQELEKYIHAIEIDNEELKICKERCDKIALSFGIMNVRWNFLNQDALNVEDFNGRMDYVVGNPPYVRIHNLTGNRNKIKSNLFCKNGMTDLYIMFYEIGIKMLNKTGILAYITPSSYFTSLAGKAMRAYLTDNELIESICDLKHFQAFNATTYTAITCLDNKKSTTIEYSEFDEEKLKPKHIANLQISDININDNFYFSDKISLSKLKNIINNKTKANFAVKNGYATLADKVFINNFSFDSEYIIPAVKASRAKWSKIIYPYDKEGKLVNESTIMKDRNLKNYLYSNKDKLLNRSNEKKSEDYWYAFGRSQGIKDTYKEKISLNALLKQPSDIKIEKVPAGCGVYSGFYILSEDIPYSKIIKALKDEDFFNYISLLGKYKNGGCYTFSSKDVTNYLNYKLSERSK